MKNMLKMAAWLSGSFGVLMMILGVIAVLSGGILMGHMWSTYFYPAYHFLLLGIFLFLGVLVTKEPK